MKAVIQRVKKASVKVGGETVGQISRGLLIFLGVFSEDTKEIAEKAAAKIIKMRIFEDENGKTNLSLADIGGGILVVSQFTLCADIKKGNRPGFDKAAKPDFANEMYEYFISLLKENCPDVRSGIFGADMEVSILNDGPFTILLDTNEL